MFKYESNVVFGSSIWKIMTDILDKVCIKLTKTNYIHKTDISLILFRVCTNTIYKQITNTLPLL